MSHNGSCSHDHDCGEHTCAGAWSLYKFIDMPKVRALNEKAQDSIKSVFKPWELRLDASSVVESSEDDELLVFIPFVNDVKIRSISIIGGSDGTSPAKMRAFTNREDIDFSLAQDLTPVQEWNLAENLNGHLEYLTREWVASPFIFHSHLQERRFGFTTLVFVGKQQISIEKQLQMLCMKQCPTRLTTSCLRHYLRHKFCNLKSYRFCFKFECKAPTSLF
eukprot:TRINITY_DN3218_c0_g1_i4.p1 TRINITY_DN3218_c0_g1~~TRINITY_DN3218_c0_g1_i4.p1  ORF type:complete len:220 (+),score=13.77 TRINITY_DN3218_c0_g1_i4:163-822(+)